jgi:hypothetical protein
MPEKRPSLQEFEFQPNALVHRPTGAMWTMRPGSTEIRSFKPSKLGMVLEDGSFYAENEVQRLAMILITKHPTPPQELETKRARPWRKGSRT